MAAKRDERKRDRRRENDMGERKREREIGTSGSGEKIVLVFWVGRLSG